MNHDGNLDLIYIEDLKHSQGGEDTSAFRILYNGSSSYNELFGRRVYDGNRVNDTSFLGLYQSNPLVLNPTLSVVPYFSLDLNDLVIPPSVTKLELQVNGYTIPLSLGSVEFNTLNNNYFAYLTGMSVSNSTWTVKAYENGVECNGPNCNLSGNLSFKFGKSPLNEKFLSGQVSSCIDGFQEHCLLGFDTGFSLAEIHTDELLDGEFEFYILAPASQTIQMTFTAMDSFPQGYQITLLEPERERVIGEDLRSAPDTQSLSISYINHTAHSQVIRGRIRGPNLEDTAVEVSLGDN